MERKGLKRSDSRQGYWRNGAAQSSQRYVKDRQESRFRSQSGGARVQPGGARVQLQGTRFGGSQSKSKNRFKSQERPKSDLAKDYEDVKTDMKKFKKLIVEMEKKR